MAKQPVLAIVVPAYNEEAVLPQSIEKLRAALAEQRADGRIAADSFILIVDDGSSDGTWRLVTDMHSRHAEVRGLSLSRNCGHQAALLAGLMRAREQAECVVSIDADLQQDVAELPEFLARYAEGNEIVYGVRRDRRSDGWFKKTSATAYYGLLRAFGVPVIPHHADYRLLGRRALAALADYSEVNIYLRGLVPQLGFRTAVVLHDVAPRPAGRSKYTLARMLAFALDGITSFGIVPLRLITAAGILISLFSALSIVGVFWTYLRYNAVHGWSSTIIPIYLLGGLQLLGIGIIGEYVGRIYLESKRRPRYTVADEC